MLACGNVGDRELVAKLYAEHHPCAGVTVAVDSHFDQSIFGPGDFIQTNIIGKLPL